MKLKNYNILVIKPRETRVPGMITHTQKDNIKMYLRECVMVWNKSNWLQRAWNGGLQQTQC